LSGWWRGKNSEGNEGFFPSTYVIAKRGKSKKQKGNALDYDEDEDYFEGADTEDLQEEEEPVSPRRQPPPVAPRTRKASFKGKDGQALKNYNPKHPGRMSKASRLKRLNELKDMSSNTIEQTGTNCSSFESLSNYLTMFFTRSK